MPINDEHRRINTILNEVEDSEINETEITINKANLLISHCNKYYIMNEDTVRIIIGISVYEIFNQHSKYLSLIKI